jgi:hypothetical protein
MTQFISQRFRSKKRPVSQTSPGSFGNEGGTGNNRDVILDAAAEAGKNDARASGIHKRDTLGKIEWTELQKAILLTVRHCIDRVVSYIALERQKLVEAELAHEGLIEQAEAKANANEAEDKKWEEKEQQQAQKVEELKRILREYEEFDGFGDSTRTNRFWKVLNAILIGVGIYVAVLISDILIFIALYPHFEVFLSGPEIRQRFIMLAGVFVASIVLYLLYKTTVDNRLSLKLLWGLSLLIVLSSTVRPILMDETFSSANVTSVITATGAGSDTLEPVHALVQQQGLIHSVGIVEAFIAMFLTSLGIYLHKRKQKTEDPDQRGFKEREYDKVKTLLEKEERELKKIKNDRLAAKLSHEEIAKAYLEAINNKEYEMVHIQQNIDSHQASLSVIINDIMLQLAEHKRVWCDYISRLANPPADLTYETITEADIRDYYGLPTSTT